MSNLFLYEKALEQHHRDMERVSKRHCLLKRDSSLHRSVMRHTVSRFGHGLVALGSWLERIEQAEQPAQSTYKY